METFFIAILTFLIAAPVILALVYGMFAIAAVLLAVRLLLGIFAPLYRPLRRWLINRFSPVRRRQPRPAAWHQWR